MERYHGGYSAREIAAELARAAREKIRLDKLQRNARVEAWRTSVALAASECTCTSSSSSTNGGGSGGGGGQSPGAYSIFHFNDATTTTLKSPGHPSSLLSYPDGQLALTTSLPTQMTAGFRTPSLMCRQCARLGAPAFMGQNEMHGTGPELRRRTSSFTRALRSLPRRLAFAPRKSRSTEHSVDGIMGSGFADARRLPNRSSQLAR